MPERTRPQDLPAGVVGLGLMGTSISACLLAAGHPVAGVEPNAQRRRNAGTRIAGLLREMRAEKLLAQPVDSVLERFQVTRACDDLSNSRLVIEAIHESGSEKQKLLRTLEEVIPRETAIGCNTSAIPISILQRGARNPKRILGIHWAEPAHVTRFLEVICGEETSPALARRVVRLARHWGKEPTLLRRDIRGFITNRCFYALLREALFLVENGYATVADVDRSLRNDLGYWITFAGPFRFMDLTGISAYDAVARDLFPELSNAPEVPGTLARLARSGAKGVANARGFYRYTPKQAERWQKLFLDFSYRIRALALEFPEGVGDRPPSRRNGRSGQ